MTTTTETTKPRNRHNHRDRLGRFVKVVDLQQLETGVFPVGGWVNDSAGETHAHDRCGGLKGRTWTIDGEADGWLCCDCIGITESAWIAALDTAPASGTKVCDGCHTEKRMRSFPTIVIVEGIRDRGRTCRKCEGRRRAMAAAA